MKLENVSLIYDDDCPLCKVYTQLFVTNKLLRKEGRVRFQDLNETNYSNLDIVRAKNEIALYNHDSDEVLYGVDSLIQLLAKKWKWVQVFQKYRFLNFLINKLYFFISYNRKIIAPDNKPICDSCLPTVNYGYRALYILFCGVTTSFTLFYFAKQVQTPLIIESIGFEFVVAFLQIPFQLIVISLLRYDTTQIWDYVGNLMTVSLMGSLALIPLFLIPNTFTFVYLAYFGAVALFMLIEHARRMKLLGFNKVLSFTWIAYRLFVLLYILFL
jgi:predicted DCC family thiol-disulfide oxidoreductase YuxK